VSITGSTVRLFAAATILVAAAIASGHGSSGIVDLGEIDVRVDAQLEATSGAERRAYLRLARVIRRESRSSNGVADDVKKLLAVLRACDGPLADDDVLRAALAAPEAQVDAYLADEPGDVAVAALRLERARDRESVEAALDGVAAFYADAVALRLAGNEPGMLMAYRNAGGGLARAARLVQHFLARQARRGVPGQPVAKGPRGTIDTFAGSGLSGATGDGGGALDASFYFPMDVAGDPTTGLVHVCDYNNHRIRFIDAGGKVRTLLASTLYPAPPGLPLAPLDHPAGVSFDAATGALYVAGWHAQAIVRMPASRDSAAVVGGGVEGDAGDGGPVADAQFDYPSCVVIDGQGGWYVADQFNQRVRYVDPSGVVHPFAGTGTAGFSGDGEAAVAAELSFPADAAGAPAGKIALSPDESTLYVADTANHRVRAVDIASGVITTLAGNGEEGSLGDGGLAKDAQLDEPVDVDCDAAGNVYVCDSGGSVVRRIDVALKTISTVAGVPNVTGFSGDGHSATLARLDRPSGIWLDRVRGRLYVADTGNNVVRVVWE
jgi:DNA-binding beta-propeller fold protein YncE